MVSTTREASNERTRLLSHATNDGEDPPLITNEDKSSTALSMRRASCIVGFLGLLIFVQATNFSILTTTQSTIAAELDSFEEAIWFTTAYLVGLSSTTPLAGRLSQIFAPRIFIFVATIIVAIGAVVTAAATSFQTFVTGRAITGIGGSGIIATATILVLQLTSAKRRGLFLGLLNMGITVGVSLGAVIAGAFVTSAGWRVMFYLQVPLVLVGGIGLFFSVPRSVEKSSKYEIAEGTVWQKLRKIDYLGAILLASAIILGLLGLSSPTIQVIPIVLSLILLPLFILYELYVAGEPIIPVTVLKSRGALLSCFATLGLMMSRWSVLFFTPVYTLAVRGWSPAVAGTILIPTNAGFGTGGLLVGALHIKKGGSYWLPSVIGIALFPLTAACLAFLSTDTSPAWLYILMTFLNGLHVGATLNYTLVHLLHLTTPQTHFIVTALLATFRGFGGSFGSAIGGGIFTRVLKRGLVEGFAKRGMSGEDDLIRRLLGSPALANRLVGVEREVAVEGYVAALKALFLAAAGLCVFITFVQAGTGWRGPNDKEADAEEDAVDGDGSGHRDSDI